MSIDCEPEPPPEMTTMSLAGTKHGQDASQAILLCTDVITLINAGSKRYSSFPIPDMTIVRYVCGAEVNLPMNSSSSHRKIIYHTTV